MLNKIMASTMVPSIVETVWLTRVGFPLGCLSSFRRHLRRHFSKKDKMITGTPMYSSAGTTSGYYTIYAQGRETNTRTPSAIRRGLFRRPILLARSKTLNLKLLSQRQAAAPSVVALHFSREAGWVFKQYPKFLTHRIVN